MHTICSIYPKASSTDERGPDTAAHQLSSLFRVSPGHPELASDLVHDRSGAALPVTLPLRRTRAAGSRHRICKRITGSRRAAEIRLLQRPSSQFHETQHAVMPRPNNTARATLTPIPTSVSVPVTIRVPAWVVSVYAAPAVVISSPAVFSTLIFTSLFIVTEVAIIPMPTPTPASFSRPIASEVARLCT